jgi:hypothetical protein
MLSIRAASFWLVEAERKIEVIKKNPNPTKRKD